MDTNERLIVNPFIIDYFLIVSKYLIKDISMNKIEKYINDYWDKHWGIHLYNYLKQNRDIKDKVSFNEEKIKNYFNSENYGKVIEDLHNCLEGIFDNSYLYFIYYDIDNIFKGIEFDYDEEILVNMLKIPYYYLRGSIKLYNNNYYLEDCGIIAQGYEDKIKFEHFFKDKELKKSVLGKLIESIDKDRITDEFGSYYTLLSIIKLYNSDKEKYKFYYDNMIEFVIHFYELSFNKVKSSSISIIINNFIQENNLDLDILNFIVKGNKGNQVNYYHLKYINDLQKKLLEEGKLYDSNDYYHNCYLLIYEIRNKINSKDIKIIHNVSPHIVGTIKYEITKFEEYKNINYLEQESFSKFKSDLIDIYNKFIKNIDFNSEENMIYENILYLQSFIKEDIKIWENFTEFLINNKDYYYKYDILENLIFNSLFNKIDKNDFDFNFFIDKLVLLYNNIIEEPYKDGIVPNEKLIHMFLDKIILILINLKLEDKFYKNIYDKIPHLHGVVRNEIEIRIFNKFPPVKIIITNGSYIVYDIKNNSTPIHTYNINDIDKLVEELVPNNDNKISRILYFKYLKEDIACKALTISHPFNFEDNNEGLYGLEKKIYIGCFSNTIDNDDSNAWWKIYGSVPDNEFDNIKVRILLNKRDLLKYILKDENFEYYFGNICYDKNVDSPNIEIKDFFYKSNEYKFENEFRILIKCKNENDNRIKKGKDEIPYLLALPINPKIYKYIKLDDNYSFNKNITDKDKNTIKYLLKEAQDKI